MKRHHILAVLALAGVVLLGAPGCSYNRFVSQEEAIKAQWAQVENQLQRRNDLIPNLVETVKGYAAHEREVFKADRRLARRSSLARSRPRRRSRRPTSRRPPLGRLLAIVENYPQLKANEQFNRLMDELAGTENRIAVERMRYNERVQAVQHAAAAVPVEHHREDVRLQGVSVLPGAA